MVGTHSAIPLSLYSLTYAVFPVARERLQHALVHALRGAEEPQQRLAVAAVPALDVAVVRRALELVSGGQQRHHSRLTAVVRANLQPPARQRA